MISKIPNILTSLRLVLAFCFLVVEAHEERVFAQVVGLILFLLASLTDIFDGLLARKYGSVTRFGRFMDPIADKVLVSSALIVFVDSSFVHVPAWPVALMISREFAVTGLRLLAAAEGVTIDAEQSGKLKTIIQMVGLHYILIVAIVENLLGSGQASALLPYLGYARMGTSIFLYGMTLITIYSGFVYLVKNYRYLVSGSQNA